MPKKIAYEKVGNSYVYEAPLVTYEKSYLSYVRVPADIAKEHKGKKFKVTIEVVDDKE